MVDPKDCLDTRPERVAIVAHGESAYRFILDTVVLTGQPHWDEVWSVNFSANSIQHDKLFQMDDLRLSEQKYKGFRENLGKHNRPIITSTVYPEYPMSVRYPIGKVIHKIQDDFFYNTVCYAIGYALYIGVKELSLYGCDFHYRDKTIAEDGGQNAAYLIGVARGFGCMIKLPVTTTLLAMDQVRYGRGMEYARQLYGYAKQPTREEESEEWAAELLKEFTKGDIPPEPLRKVA